MQSDILPPGAGSTTLDQLHLDVAATPEQIWQVRRHVADWTRRHAWGEDDSDALLLAVGEACNNAVNYGRKDLPDPRLFVSCRHLGGNEMEVDVRNQGNNFHPDLERMGHMPDENATCGRGFGLMMALVDDVKVLSDGENTTIRLRKTRSA